MADVEIILCPQERISATMTLIRRDDDEGLASLDELIADFPRDPRLHFLKGSVLAGNQRYIEGLEAMRRAIAIAPDYALARFQTGFLELTSGFPALAAATWEPFASLEEDAPFRLLAQGLNSLSADDFAQAERDILRGIEANTEHPLINDDMRLLLDEMLNGTAERPFADEKPAGETSAVHQLLQQFELRDIENRTRH